MDQYTLLHFAVGVVFYFWGSTLSNWIIIHILFELFENSDIGVKVINDINIWPGGKPRKDTAVNIIGDILFGILGWISAYYLDKLGNRHGIYAH